MVEKSVYYVWYDKEDAKDMLTGIAFRQTDYFRDDVVQSAASHFYNECDGWEWMRSGCTLYSVKDGESEVYSHEVSVDFEPVFYVAFGEVME